jgi:hypothetical protein
LVPSRSSRNTATWPTVVVASEICTYCFCPARFTVPFETMPSTAASSVSTPPDWTGVPYAVHFAVSIVAPSKVSETGGPAGEPCGVMALTSSMSADDDEPEVFFADRITRVEVTQAGLVNGVVVRWVQRKVCALTSQTPVST